MSIQSTTVNVVPAHHHEQILVVPREKLFDGQAPLSGLIQGVVDQRIAQCRSVIEQYGEYHPRYLMETDERYKQIIPYFIFSYDGMLFLMQRSSQASESRLANKYSLGIGGHIYRSDIEGKTIEEWGLREFHEEVSYSGNLSFKALGVLNDEATPVDRVHLGIVFMLYGDSSKISIKSELQSGQLCTYEECEEKYEQMERWSQLVFDTLKKARYI